MLKNKIHTLPARVKKLFPYAVLIGVLITSVACGTANAAAQVIPVTAATEAPLATDPSPANASSSNPKCDALFLANYDMGMALAAMVNLTAQTDYSAYTTPGSPFYLDFKKLRSELDTLATLPDPSAADALIVGKPSEAVTYFHQLLDLAETDIKNQGSPFVDTSPDGVKMMGMDTPWMKHAAVFGVAMGTVCENYSAPSDLFVGTPIATVDAQALQANDSLMATAAAAGSSMLATLDAAQTAYPEPTETPSP